jgi:hypothetical protein
MGGGWALELDIQSYCYTVGKHHLRNFLDRWFEEEVKPRLQGRAFLMGNNESCCSLVYQGITRTSE